MMKLPLAHKKLLVVIFSVGSDRLGLPLSVEEVLKATSSCSYLCLVGYNSGFPHCCRHWEMIKEAKDNKWHDFHTFFFTGLFLSASYCNSCSNIIRHTNHCLDFWWGKYHLLPLLVTFSTGQVIWKWQHHNRSYLHRRRDFSKEWILDSINALLPNAQNFSGKTLKSDYLVVMKTERAHTEEERPGRSVTRLPTASLTFLGNTGFSCWSLWALKAQAQRMKCAAVTVLLSSLFNRWMIK